MPFSAGWVTDKWFVYEIKDDHLWGYELHEFALHTCDEVPTGEPGVGCLHGVITNMIERRNCRTWIARRGAVHAFGPYTPEEAARQMEKIQAHFVARKGGATPANTE